MATRTRARYVNSGTGKDSNMPAHQYTWNIVSKEREYGDDAYLLTREL